jgi:hypothetical protein
MAGAALEAAEVALRDALGRQRALLRDLLCEFETLLR